MLYHIYSSLYRKKCSSIHFYHMCPKDFTIDCTINTVLEPALPYLSAKDGDLWGGSNPSGHGTSVPKTQSMRD